MSEFMKLYNGMLRGIRDWTRWDTFQQTLVEQSDGGWYVYFVGVDFPQAPLDAVTFRKVLGAIDILLHHDHKERYLGIVYVDDFEHPQLVKIYDPNNLGASCGSSGKVVPAGWILSRIPPEPLGEFVVPEGRKRWWREIFQD
ncbi:MAG: hypothetical protein PHG39_06830 [Acidithiobacillus ferrooxidans]|uniref:Uncharacterized protein n=1 Tax=Acidithiobacillus ferruginosus TaxID=3063951 RepID=A0ACD5IK12_9PROT|nr:hypothetical protein [Acidithiobacillus ferruginosus]MBU2812835.1 hypothetical protein [Acidithiobacillus ferruginosus]MDD2747252.1 hypothetical protein [Acidithiobacillus ferrooxidans]MDD5378463.1 hypothetical protein [Acidithiobacillus sp.]MDD5575554.1 hypothetical protein [Acidithiobacillus sp.]